MYKKIILTSIKYLNFLTNKKKKHLFNYLNLVIKLDWTEHAAFNFKKKAFESFDSTIEKNEANKQINFYLN